MDPYPNSSLFNKSDFFPTVNKNPDPQPWFLLMPPLSISITDCGNKCYGRDSFPTTICPRSSDPFCIVTYYIRLVTTSWTYSSKRFF